MFVSGTSALQRVSVLICVGFVASRIPWLDAPVQLRRNICQKGGKYTQTLGHFWEQQGIILTTHLISSVIRVCGDSACFRAERRFD